MKKIVYMKVGKPGEGLTLLLAGTVLNHIVLAQLPITTISCRDWEASATPKLLSHYWLQEYSWIKHFPWFEKMISLQFQSWGNAYMEVKEGKVTIYNVDACPLTEEMAVAARHVYAC